MKIIARIHTDFPEKFGIPRQSGLISELKGRIVLEKEYRNKDAVRGLEEFSHVWLLWQFSEAMRDTWSPTVRPPLLGGNTRMGVFATRSPFRPNPIGLSCVKLESIDTECEDAPVIYVSGVDLMDGTPIYDIKPYLPYVDCRPEATGGFTDNLSERRLQVEMEPELLMKVSKEKQEALIKVLESDPRPSYQNDPERVYGMSYAGYEISFKVAEGVLRVCGIK